VCVPGGDTDDVDGDGFTPLGGDCEDCDPRRNPNAIEAPTTDGVPLDEDCDGAIDEVEPQVFCDQDLLIDTEDALAAASAVDLCKMSTGPTDWGVVSAAWVMADGSPPPSDPINLSNFHLGHGMLTALGPNSPRRSGTKMLALSSGTARSPSDPHYITVAGFEKAYTGEFAPGFPKEAAACPGIITGPPRDVVGVELAIRAPSNAEGFSFEFNFHTFEWPGFVCSPFNDFFLAILDPIPEGQTDGNISFDEMGNPISVNNALLRVCGCEGNPPNACLVDSLVATLSYECDLGNTSLFGTGFGFDTAVDDRAATGWLKSTAPVDGGTEFRLRLAVHDSGDGSLDSTTLIDNFQWILEPGTVVETVPVPQ
jgi:hypothetical protein